MNENNGIRIVCNGVFHAYVEDGSQAMGHVLELGMTSLHYMSADAIKNYILEAMLLAEETIGWNDDVVKRRREDSSLRKRITMYRKSLDHIGEDRENLMMMYVNIAMSCNNLGQLSGFSMVNTTNTQGRNKTKSSMYRNPEKQSMYK